jgi:hypothetical protein
LAAWLLRPCRYITARQFNPTSSHANGGCPYLMGDGFVGGDGCSSAVADFKATLWQRRARRKNTNSRGMFVKWKGIFGIFT